MRRGNIRIAKGHTGNTPTKIYHTQYVGRDKVNTMTRYEEMMNKAVEMLKKNDDLFCDMVNELDSWNGFADGYRAYPMYELDELFGHMKLTDFLDIITEDFRPSDEYIIDTIWGLESTDWLADHYRSNVDEEELLENIIENRSNLWINDNEFEELLDEIEEAEEEEAELQEAA